MAKTFYRSVIQVEILSEAPLPDDITLDEVSYEITFGDWSGLVTDVVSNEPISPQKCARLLEKQGSCPSFFNLSAGRPSSE